jgi:aspartyl-tRNA(Asn)/glutamyl-tRNA(Gln) amidotransferase subunit B
MFEHLQIYESVIGPEVDVQLSATCKLFYYDSLSSGNLPDHNVSLVLRGLPASFPKLKKQIVEHEIILRLATNFKIARQFSHDRKSYFNTDLPKAYQISHDKDPNCYFSFFALKTKNRLNKKILLTKIHIDTD